METKPKTDPEKPLTRIIRLSALKNVAGVKETGQAEVNSHNLIKLSYVKLQALPKEGL